MTRFSFLLLVVFFVLTGCDAQGYGGGGYSGYGGSNSYGGYGGGNNYAGYGYQNAGYTNSAQKTLALKWENNVGTSIHGGDSDCTSDSCFPSVDVYDECEGKIIGKVASACNTTCTPTGPQIKRNEHTPPCPGSVSECDFTFTTSYGGFTITGLVQSQVSFEVSDTPSPSPPPECVENTSGPTYLACSDCKVTNPTGDYKYREVDFETLFGKDNDEVATTWVTVSLGEKQHQNYEGYGYEKPNYGQPGGNYANPYQKPQYGSYSQSYGQSYGYGGYQGYPSETPKQTPPPASYKPPTPPSYGGYQPTPSYDGYKQPSQPSYGGYTPPSYGGYKPTPTSYGGYQQPTPPSYSGYKQPTPPSYGGYQQPTPPSYGGYKQPTPPSYGGYQQPTPSSYGGYQQQTPPSYGGYQQPSQQSYGGYKQPSYGGYQSPYGGQTPSYGGYPKPSYGGGY